MLTPFKSILFLGECMVEHRADGDVFFGGDSFNTAYYLSQLLTDHTQAPVQIYYATAIGNDNQSEMLTALMTQSGIQLDFVARHPIKTLGQYWVDVCDSGERSFRFDRQNSAARDYLVLSNKLLTALETKQVDAIYLSGISLAILDEKHRALLINALQQFKAKGGIIYFDNNYRPALWQSISPIHDYFSLMALADIAFLTDEDEYAVYGTQTVSDIIDLHFKGHSYKQTLVIRQGAAPCVIQKPNEDSLIYVAAKQLSKDQVIDTCAAGDSFAAGFLAAMVTGLNTQTAAHYAHKVAASVIKQHGALIPTHYLPKLSNQECLGADSFFY